MPRVGARAHPFRRVRFDIPHQLRETGFVLHKELQDPGCVIALGNCVGHGGLNGVTQLGHEHRRAGLGPGRRQFEQGPDTHPVLKQEATTLRQVLGPGQEIGKRRRSGVERFYRRRGERSGL